MRAHDRAQHIVGVPQAGRPLAHGAGHRVLERGGARAHAVHPRAQQAHAVDVERLAAHVFLAHVDVALHVEECRRRGRCHAVLSRTGLGQQAGFSHALCQQRLAQHVVDFVGAGVVEVFALEVDFCPAQVLAHFLCVVEQRGAAGVIFEKVSKLCLKVLVVFVKVVGLLQLGKRPHQPLGDVLPAVRAKSSLGSQMLRHQKKLLCIWCVGPCRPCRESVFRFTIAGARAAGREGRKKAACSTNQTPPRRCFCRRQKNTRPRRKTSRTSVKHTRGATLLHEADPGPCPLTGYRHIPGNSRMPTRRRILGFVKSL